MGINTMGVEHRPIQERLATKPEEPKKMSAATQLLNIAVRAGNLAYDTSRSAESYRLAGRLSRLVQFRLSDLSEREVTAFAEAHVQSAKTGNDLFAGHPHSFYLLQSAIAQVSYRIWEDLWNEKHPDQIGKAWHGQDFALMSVWREKVIVMIKDCRQHAVLALNPEEYVAELTEDGASEEAAVDLAEWLWEVEYGGNTPST